MPKRAKWLDFPEEVKLELLARMVASHFSGYRTHLAWLKTKGCVTSKTALHNTMKPYEDLLALVHLAKVLQGACGEKIDLGVALHAVAAIELSKSVEALITHRDHAETIDRESVKLLSDVAKNISALSRASMGAQRLRLTVGSRLGALKPPNNKK
jgi:hypothetical protein